MACNHCSTLLKDLNNGIDATKLGPGWVKEERTDFSGPHEYWRTCIYRHHVNMGELRASSSACEVCKYLSSCSMTAQQATDETKITLYVLNRDARDGDFSGLLYFRGGEPVHPVSDIQGFLVVLQIYSPIGTHTSPDPFVLKYRGIGMGVGVAEGSINSLSLGRGIVRSPQSSATDLGSLVRLIQGWLQNCVDHHATCPRTTNFVPTRLIDVGAADGSVEPCLRKTTPQDRGARYVAVSYCWGDSKQADQNLKTTDGNLPQRLRSIPFNDFPDVLQDAVRITRKLGIRYIWIDALCIIQEQPLETDWKAEAGNMAQIYSSSWLTISASASNYCKQAMLQRRGDADVGIVVDIPSATDRTNTIGIRCAPRKLTDELARSKISGRGWTMQERDLSCRVLHFTRSQLYWECAVDTHHEDGKSESNSLGKVMPGHSHWTHRRDVQALSDNDREDMAMRWYQIIQDYGHRAFTNSEHCLPALAGLTREYSRYFPGGEYLAGLWEVQLPACLMWSPHPGLQKRKALSSRDAAGVLHKIPSWSWAVYDGVVYQDLVGSLVRLLRGSYFGGFLAVVQHASVDADDEDSRYLGRINNGTITLRGKLQRLHYHSEPNRAGLYRLGEDTSIAIPPTHNSHGVGMDRDRDMSQGCWGMPIAKTSGKNLETSEDTECEFAILLLQQVNPPDMVFERCGTDYVIGERYLTLFEGAPEVSIVIH